jgi:hypothetical protein
MEKNLSKTGEFGELEKVTPNLKREKTEKRTKISVLVISPRA